MARFPTIEEFAKEAAEKALDDFEFEGKTIREWAELILSGDSVPVVRCKDCKKREICRTTNIWAIAPDDEWFCADGERRTNDRA